MQDEKAPGPFIIPQRGMLGPRRPPGPWASPCPVKGASAPGFLSLLISGRAPTTQEDCRPSCMYAPTVPGVIQGSQLPSTCDPEALGRCGPCHRKESPLGAAPPACRRRPHFSLAPCPGSTETCWATLRSLCWYSKSEPTCVLILQ